MEVLSSNDSSGDKLFVTIEGNNVEISSYDWNNDLEVTININKGELLKVLNKSKEE